jgi:UDP-N-acetylglucosamine 4-epimerase
LRYFNVFGPRQDPGGAYAAVIPKWTAALIKGEKVYINGDGSTSRDFCFVKNAIQANLLAATRETISPQSDVFNVAVGGRTDLKSLFALIRDELVRSGHAVSQSVPVLRDFRDGDVRHSQADISKANEMLGYVPQYDIRRGIAEAMPWYLANVGI